jgi:thiamine biosynthesis lipoprotein
MGTTVSITASGRERDRAGAYAGDVRPAVEDMESRWSVYRADSEISRLGRAAGKEAVPVSRETVRTLRLALKYAELSGGAFDPTVGPLVRLWGFSGGAVPKAVPDGRRISDAMARVGYGRLLVGDDSARLAAPGMMVDLGGIGKGYAADVCWERLRRMGARHAMVNMGGNVRCIGLAGPGRRWRIGMRNPFDREKLLGVIDLPPGMAVATSGNYERFVTIGGKRYAHILDPRTGRPVEGMAGVTVIARTAVEADAMSTALFVLGPTRQAGAALARLPGCHAAFVPDALPPRLVLSGGFGRYFTPDPEAGGRVSGLGDAAEAAAGPREGREQ